ncbi:MAG: single-stranded nucleic acid binding domain protein [Acidimicrobiales bacterium]|nr:single-stranded nucleic acid binding domain protein [Acidimicrobiales bacterium]
MEWVETTGRTVEEAKDAALDQLGVDEQDAEFEVLEEAKSGLFGRLRQEARVRARVRPTTPRPKVERRDRKRKPAASAEAPAETLVGTAAEAPASKPAPRKRAPKQERPARPAPVPTTTGAVPMEDLDLDAQAANVRSFLEGLVDAFALQGAVTVDAIDDDTLEARVDGEDLGLLIGPKGQTLQSVQELTRAILQKDGPGGPRLRLDVGGYRERRRVALDRFTRGIAEQVLASGTPTSLEPMGAADRKVVHDTVNEIDGVRTISEGEEPRRRVVILPDED